MQHDLTHCDAAICKKRFKCRRYMAHIDRINRGLKGHYPYLTHTIDLGYGKTYTMNVEDGCSEFIPN